MRTAQKVSYGIILKLSEKLIPNPYRSRFCFCLNAATVAEINVNGEVSLIIGLWFCSVNTFGFSIIYFILFVAIKKQIDF